MTSLPGMKKNNMAAKYVLLVFKVLLYKQTLNIFFGKQTVKVKKDFTQKTEEQVSFSILTCNVGYATLILLAQFSFGSALKME